MLFPQNLERGGRLSSILRKHLKPKFLKGPLWARDGMAPGENLARTNEKKLGENSSPDYQVMVTVKTSW